MGGEAMNPKDLRDLVPPELLGEDSRLVEILGLLPQQACADLVASASVSMFQNGDVILPEGARSERIGYVIDGALGMEKSLPDGRTHLIGLLVPTDMYGRLFDGGSTYDLVALSDSRVFTFARDAFENVLVGSPEVERRFLVSLLDELDAAREWILLLGGHKVIERVSSFLLVMLRRNLRSTAARNGTASGRVIRIPIRRADLAHHLGARPESISRALHDLEKRGIVELIDPNTIRVRDLAGLVKISGSDLLVGVE
jgi:CRP/FNR family transcriptional regulator